MSETFVFAAVAGGRGSADLIFVHGLTGDKVTTWTSHKSGDPSGDYWPRWLADDVPGLNVYTLGYPASLFEKWAKKEMGLYDRAKASLDYLSSYDIGSRPLGFVTHSLGGLLAKQMVRTGYEASDAHWRAIAKSCRLMIFLGTPHTGASLASVLQFAFPRLSSRHIGTLQNESSELDELNTAYRRLATNLDIQTTSFYEQFKTKGMLQVVSRVHADPGLPTAELIAVDADHITICKPSSRHHEVYRAVYRRARSLVSNSAVRPQSIPAQDGKPALLTAHIFGEAPDREIYFVLPFDGVTAFGVPITFELSAPVAYRVRTVLVQAEMADSVYLHELPRTLDNISVGREIQVYIDRTRNENIARVMYKIPYITPGMGVSIQDTLFAKSPSVLEIDTPTQSREGAKIRVKSKVVLSTPIELLINGEDILPWSTSIALHFRQGDIDDFTAVKRRENNLIKEIMQSGSSPVKPANVMFVGFRRFTDRQVPSNLLAIKDADLASMVIFRGRRTPRGLEMSS